MYSSTLPWVFSLINKGFTASQNIYQNLRLYFKCTEDVRLQHHLGFFFFLTRKLFSKYFPRHHHLDHTWVVWSQVFNSNLDHIWQVLLWHHSEPGGKSQWHTPAGPQISNCPSHAILKNSGRRRVNTDSLHLSILPQCLPLEKQMQFPRGVNNLPSDHPAPSAAPLFPALAKSKGLYDLQWHYK